MYILIESDKKKLIELVGECEDCGVKENLTIHRIKRGYMGGLYTLRNIKILCADCHRLYHYQEPGMRGR